VASKSKRSLRRGLPNIPTDSFSDIAFLLIIFFIVATTINRVAGFMTDMPAGEKTEKPMVESPTVQIQDDRIIFKNAPMDVPELRKRLLELNLSEKHGDQKVVMLEATGSVDYQRYFEVMACISKAGGLVAIVKEETGKKAEGRSEGGGE
jgi:biopolymer transport protein ExbD